MFSKNPFAQKIGLEAKTVTIVGVDDVGRCIVWVETNHEFAIKYLFGYDHGVAVLDMIDMISR